jgi:hypothetical protein
MLVSEEVRMIGFESFVGRGKSADWTRTSICF